MREVMVTQWKMNKRLGFPWMSASGYWMVFFGQLTCVNKFLLAAGPLRLLTPTKLSGPQLHVSGEVWFLVCNQHRGEALVHSATYRINTSTQ